MRAIFYYFVSGETVFFVLPYAKNELENLTHAQQKQLRQIAQEIENNG